MQLLKKIAVFVDWENIRKGIFIKASKQYPHPINYNQIENVEELIFAFILPAEEEIYRIFFYLAKPFGDTLGGQDYSQTRTYRHATSFLERLEVRDLIAVRKGDLRFQGYDNRNEPIFEQKKVDMLFGLDIAHVSYRKLVDRVLILCADTDMIPAMKTARINGLQVIFGFCPDIQNDIRRELKVHSDFIRAIEFKDIFPNAL
jgi:uncharacterized LabA/DUF88 family protein